MIERLPRQPYARTLSPAGRGHGAARARVLVCARAEAPTNHSLSPAGRGHGAMDGSALCDVLSALACPETLLDLDLGSAQCGRQRELKFR